MRMLDIDPSVMNPESLNQKIQARVIAVNANSMFDEVSEEMMLHTSTVSSRELRVQMLKVYENFHKMDVCWELKPLEIRSNRPVIGKVIVFAKKAVRKLTRWLMQPYWDQITVFHSATTVTICEMIRVQEMLISAEEKKDVQ